jgi:hypothetical protein
MTPSQMIGRKPTASLPECCEVDLKATSYDYASSSATSPFECIKLHLCPICGEHGISSTIWDMKTTFFYCRDRAHIFEVDDTSQVVDRIGR